MPGMMLWDTLNLERGDYSASHFGRGLSRGPQYFPPAARGRKRGRRRVLERAGDFSLQTCDPVGGDGISPNRSS